MPSHKIFKPLQVYEHAAGWARQNFRRIEFKKNFCIVTTGKRVNRKYRYLITTTMMIIITIIVKHQIAAVSTKKKKINK